MKPSYTEFDPLKRITSTKNQKPIRIANIISNYFLEAFVFNNSDVYNSILNKINKKKSNLKPPYTALNALKRTAAG